jgi:hypothetical protein
MRRRRSRSRLFWAGVALGLLLLVLAATVASAALAAPGAARRLAGRLAALVLVRQEGARTMRRSIPTALAALAAGVALGSVSLASASPAARGAETLTLVARDSGSETYVDVGAKGDSPGDGVYFSETLHQGARRVGRSDVVCHFFGRNTGRCAGTLSLATGRLEAAGTIRFGDGPFSIPILGGTGTYAGASGVLRVVPLGERRDRYVIRLVG